MITIQNLARASATAGMLALALVATTATSSPQDKGWYVGGNIGPSTHEIDDERIPSALKAGGFTTTGLDDENWDVGYKFLGGYRFNRYFALEGSYFDMGEFGFVANTNPAGTLSGDTEIKSVNLDPVAIWPIDQRWSAIARAGLNYAEATSTYS